jgi:hypothetical protein
MLVDMQRMPQTRNERANSAQNDRDQGTIHLHWECLTDQHHSRKDQKKAVLQDMYIANATPPR